MNRMELTFVLTVVTSLNMKSVETKMVSIATSGFSECLAKCLIFLPIIALDSDFNTSILIWLCICVCVCVCVCLSVCGGRLVR